MPATDHDVVVVGAGNPAFCVALAARERGCSVLMLERAPEEESGGNSRFTIGAVRFACRGVDDLKAIMPNLSEDEIAKTDFSTYTTGQFSDNMFRITVYRTDPALCELLATKSFYAMLWLRSKGVRFAPIYGWQAFRIEGKFKLWDGLTVEAWGGGPGLIRQLTAIALKSGIEIRYDTQVVSLIHVNDRVEGVRVKEAFGVHDTPSRAVVLACGGFEANAEWRTRYLGPGWELAKVRGLRFNMGDGIDMALKIGAMPYGNWSGCHAVGWDYNAPEFGDLAVGNGFLKHSYPFGIMLNSNGYRFFDEGADFRNYTCAQYGRAVLEQPDQVAWQIFDSKVCHLLRDEYKIKRVTKVSANSIDELARKLDGVNREAFLAEVRGFNAAVRVDIPFNPAIKDGRCTKGLKLPKSNWANRIDEPPFEAYQVGCGITFTFGGLRLDPTRAQVLDTDFKPMPSLHAAGGACGRTFLFQLSGRHGPDLRSGVWPRRRERSGAGRREMSLPAGAAAP